MANAEHLIILKQGVVAWNDWRERNSDVRPDLRGAELNTDIYNLHDFRHGNFRGADLAFAEIWSACLEGADFCGADFSEADLYFADLENADLRNADFDDARLRFVDLAGADLAGASMGRTIILETDLSQTKGLDEILHRAPTAIDSRVFEATAGGLATDRSRQPEIETFYRRAGVAEHLIQYYRTRVGEPIEFYSGFISYSHEDKLFARRLYEALQDHGIRCWLDEKQMLPGDDLYEQVDRGIRLWDKLLLCCSQHSLTSWWVDNEIGVAFEKEQQRMKRNAGNVQTIIPLALDGYMFSDKWSSGYSAQIRRRAAADFSGWEADASEFDRQIERVVQALRADAAGRDAPPKPKL